MPKKRPKKNWGDIKSRIKNRKTKYKTDERIYKPTFNDSNQAKVTMRFLDSPDTELPYAEQSSHFFKDVGGWFIANCPTTPGIDGNCPVCDHLYKENYYETDNDLYYERKKSTYYYTNVLIVEDKNCPENEGKVFLLKFGKKIMEKVDDAFDDDKNIWEPGKPQCNFIFSAKKKGKMSNYDASYFSDSETDLSDYGDEDKIYAQCHELGTFTDPDEYKDEEELKTKYFKVIAESSAEAGGSTKKKRKRIDEDDEMESDVITDDDELDDETMLDDDDDDTFFDDLDDDDED